MGSITKGYRTADAMLNRRAMNEYRKVLTQQNELKLMMEMTDMQQEERKRAFGESAIAVTRAIESLDLLQKFKESGAMVPPTILEKLNQDVQMGMNTYLNRPNRQTQGTYRYDGAVPTGDGLYSLLASRVGDEGEKKSGPLNFMGEVSDGDDIAMFTMDDLKDLGFQYLGELKAAESLMSALEVQANMLKRLIDPEEWVKQEGRETLADKKHEGSMELEGLRQQGREKLQASAHDQDLGMEGVKQEGRVELEKMRQGGRQELEGVKQEGRMEKLGAGQEFRLALQNAKQEDAIELIEHRKGIDHDFKREMEKIEHDRKMEYLRERMKSDQAFKREMKAVGETAALQRLERRLESDKDFKREMMKVKHMAAIDLLDRRAASRPKRQEKPPKPHDLVKQVNSPEFQSMVLDHANAAGFEREEAAAFTEGVSREMRQRAAAGENPYEVYEEVLEEQEEKVRSQRQPGAWDRLRNWWRGGQGAPEAEAQQPQVSPLLEALQRAQQK